MLPIDQKEIETKLDTFNWNFKVGDNIKHNVQEVFFLYKIKKEICSNTKEKQFLNKHISINLVAIIEAILYDFVVRLSDATNQFPLIIDDKKRKDIKKYIALSDIVRNRNFVPLMTGERFLGFCRVITKIVRKICSVKPQYSAALHPPM